MAAAIFNPPRDGKVFGIMDFPFQNAQEAINKWNSEGHHVTATHYYMSTMGHVLGTWVPRSKLLRTVGKGLPAPESHDFSSRPRWWKGPYHCEGARRR